MIAALAIFVALVLGVTVYFAGGLRRLVLDGSAEEARHRSSDMPTVSVAVPNGVDIADLRAAAARGGFTTWVTTSGSQQCLQVVCHETDRAPLRHLLEEAHGASYAGTELDLHPVVFEDERR